jgi:hypothetical protein
MKIKWLSGEIFRDMTIKKAPVSMVENYIVPYFAL